MLLWVVAFLAFAGLSVNWSKSIALSHNGMAMAPFDLPDSLRQLAFVPDESTPLKYLGAEVTFSMDWQRQFAKIERCINLFCHRVLCNRLPLRHAVSVLNLRLIPALSYSFAFTPVPPKVLLHWNHTLAARLASLIVRDFRPTRLEALSLSTGVRMISDVYYAVSATELFIELNSEPMHSMYELLLVHGGSDFFANPLRASNTRLSRSSSYLKNAGIFFRWPCDLMHALPAGPSASFNFSGVPLPICSMPSNDSIMPAASVPARPVEIFSDASRQPDTGSSRFGFLSLSDSWHDGAAIASVSRSEIVRNVLSLALPTSVSFDFTDSSTEAECMAVLSVLLSHPSNVPLSIYSDSHSTLQSVKSAYSVDLSRPSRKFLRSPLRAPLMGVIRAQRSRSALLLSPSCVRILLRMIILVVVIVRLMLLSARN